MFSSLLSRHIRYTIPRYEKAISLPLSGAANLELSLVAIAIVGGEEKVPLFVLFDALV